MWLVTEALRQGMILRDSVRLANECQSPRSVCSMGSQRSPVGLNRRGAIRGSAAALSRYSRSTSISISTDGSAGAPAGTPRARPSRAASPAAMAAARRLPTLLALWKWPPWLVVVLTAPPAEARARWAW